MSGNADHPGRVRVSPVNVHAHVHVIRPAERSHPAGAGGPAVFVGRARKAAASPAAAAVGRVSVVRLVHLHAQHAALLHVAQDLIDAEAD